MSKNSNDAPKVDIYERVTNAIIEQLEKGVRPWQKPWAVAGGSDVTFPLRANGVPYRGINVFLLWGAALAGNYSSPYWLTYNQAKSDGGNVKKGEKGTLVIYASRIEKPKKDDPSEKESIFFWKGFTVFNAEQCENLPAKYFPKAGEVTPAQKAERIAHAEAFFTKVRAEVKHGGPRAFYSPGGDFIQLPDFDAFRDSESYYATSGHEHIHWTGAASRCNREYGKRFGDAAYSCEELVAELGSAFLCAELGLTLEVREDHASYLASWLKVLKGDKRFIIQAASAAQKAVTFLKDAAGEGVEAPEAEGEGEAVAQAA
jgi:antirestriction protein ArdC